MLTVLIVDDDAGMRVLARRLLGMIVECKTFEAINGHEGETIALEHQPDLVLLDLMMPVQDGFETCSRLREKGYSGTIIFVSTLGETGGKQKAAEYGANAYVQKPVSRDGLKQCLEYVTV